MVLYNVINTVGLLKFVKRFASKNIVNKEKWLYSNQIICYMYFITCLALTEYEQKMCLLLSEQENRLYAVLVLPT